MSVKKNMPIKEKVKEQQSHELQGGNKIQPNKILLLHIEPYLHTVSADPVLCITFGKHLLIPYFIILLQAGVVNLGTGLLEWEIIPVKGLR